MIKRLLWLAVGFGLGLGSSFAVVRRVRRIVARFAPAEVADRFGESVTGWRRGVKVAVAEGRAAMREREAELQAGLPGRNGHR